MDVSLSERRIKRHLSESPVCDVSSTRSFRCYSTSLTGGLGVGAMPRSILWAVVMGADWAANFFLKAISRPVNKASCIPPTTRNFGPARFAFFLERGAGRNPAEAQRSPVWVRIPTPHIPAPWGPGLLTVKLTQGQAIMRCRVALMPTHSDGSQNSSDSNLPQSVCDRPATLGTVAKMSNRQNPHDLNQPAWVARIGRHVRIAPQIEIIR